MDLVSVDSAEIFGSNGCAVDFAKLQLKAMPLLFCATFALLHMAK